MNFSKFAPHYTWLTNHGLWREAVRQMAKHLPPSGSRLRLLDIGCGAGTTQRTLHTLRPDITAIGLDPAWGMAKLAKTSTVIEGEVYLQGDGLHLPFAENSIDAVIIQRLYYFLPHKPALLAEALRVLRPGGRLIMVDPQDGKSPWGAWREILGGRAALDMFAWHVAARAMGGVTLTSMAAALQTAGYARILTEPTAHGWGVLSRGEKPYAAGTATPDRIAVGAAESVPGKFLHLLIKQTPNKPAWAMKPEDIITWGAVAVHEDQPVVLAFSSLPKAVAFMQAAVMAGAIQEVSKVAKFKKDTAWDFPVKLNPTFEALAGSAFTLIGVDPAQAEAPDE